MPELSKLNLILFVKRKWKNKSARILFAICAYPDVSVVRPLFLPPSFNGVNIPRAWYWKEQKGAENRLKKIVKLERENF